MTDIDSLKAWAHRLHQRVEWLEKTILPYADARATTAEVFLRAPQCEIERLARQLRSGIDAVQRVEAQLAAREGEIATLKEQVKDAQSEAAVYRHTVAACGAEMDELIAHAGAADHRRLAAEYRATRIKLDEELRQRAEAAEARADTAEAQLRAQGWQPTETAPKDEVRVLLFNPDESLGAWAVQAGAHYEQLGGWQYDNQNPRYSNAHPPTHWMPLPAPPITKEPQPHE